MRRTILPEARRGLLRARLAKGRPIRAIECHNALSAMIGAEASGTNGLRFDALWASGFAHATTRGLPDAELALIERKLDSVAEIASASALPIIVDADTGGDLLAFTELCIRLEYLGASAVIVEDKAGAKRTSLAADVDHVMEDPHVFADKIATARAAMASGDVMLFARIESLIAGRGLDDALARARIYLESLADGLVIHSKEKTGDEILAFLSGYRALQAELGITKPIVLIPTAYPHLTGAELAESGASIVIHGNHLVRAAFRAMRETAGLILDHDRALEADAHIAPVADLFAAVGVDLPMPERRDR
ncbi:MAG: isocitrate lyase/phosphoenolpyruvate mutase family protein [Sphingopyxis sp.]|nr:isocitrate lyase/phosphoenolpyruvate mutase family protein [Sphingopyxis sp.]